MSSFRFCIKYKDNKDTNALRNQLEEIIKPYNGRITSVGYTTGNIHEYPNDFVLLFSSITYLRHCQGLIKNQISDIKFGDVY